MTEGASDLRIAIIGMAGRFPGARNIDELWQLLSDGRHAGEEIPEDELRSAGVTDAQLADPRFVRTCMPLADYDRFDANFFACTPRQAADMDPQHRLFLECAWEAIENAGYACDALEGPVGVFASAGTSSYLFAHWTNSSPLEFSRHVVDADKDFLASRVSYKLGLTGPSMAVQTGCSGSLAAVHVAVQSLLNVESDVAVAGGASLRLPHRCGYLCRDGDIFSPDGICRAFDLQANGAVPSSAVAVVVLKRFAEAVADGDHIHAVIRGTAVNNDGASKAGFAAPSPQAQARVIANALALADVRAADLDYIEGHGSGTALGDAIELSALDSLLRDAAAQPRSCAVGSIKTNLGHLDAASGIVGLIKTALCLQHRQLVPSLHFATPNSVLALATSPLHVNTESRHWRQRPGARRLAGVSSFGMGGTNVHAVLEEAPGIAAVHDCGMTELFCFSAATPSALTSTLRNAADHLERQSEFRLHDHAFTTQVGRKAFAHRAFVVAGNASDLMAALRSSAASELHRGESPGTRFLCLVLPGSNGNSAPDVASLYEADTSFRCDIDRCAELLAKYCGISRAVCFPTAQATQGGHGDDPRQDRDPLSIEAARLITQWSVARLYFRWGLRPSMLIGEGVGRYVGACLAGRLSLEEMVRLFAEHCRIVEHFASVPLDLHKLPAAENAPCGFIQDNGKSLPPEFDMVMHDPRNLLLEIGDGQSLAADRISTTRISTTESAAARYVVVSGHTPGTPPLWQRETLLRSAGEAWLRGCSFDARGDEGKVRGHRVPMPTYPFQRSRHWIDTSSAFAGTQPRMSGTECRT